MVEQAFERVNTASERDLLPLPDLMQEIHDARKADSANGSPVQYRANLSQDFRSRANSVELTDPFKDKAGEAGAKAATERREFEKRDPSERQRSDTPERRYDNATLLQAFTDSSKTGLPLVVVIGESWCTHCQHMNEKVWPKVEGARDSKGTLAGKAVFLHLDYDQSESLQGEPGRIARSLRQGIEGFPTVRLYSVSPEGRASFKGQQVGAMSQEKLEKFLKESGVK
jgi:hypothetical protein